MTFTRALALAVVLVTGPGGSLLVAEELALETNADAVKVNLERQVGKRVKLKLVSGQDIEGTVVAVGTAGVHVARVSGADFFDALVRLDQIAAVLVRARGN